MIAAIQLRGNIDARQTVKDTLRMLGLGRKHRCKLFEETPVNVGMLNKCRDFITYGPVSAETVKLLEKHFKDGVARLHPPRGGFRSIKRSVNAGGDLGLRAEGGMDSLIGRMLP